MVGLVPVKGAAVAEENLLIFEQVKHELFVALDVELFGINFGKQVERAVGLFTGNAVDFVEHTIRQGALLVETPAGGNEFVNGLVAAECGLNCMLGGHVRAQAHRRKQGNALNIVFSILFRPGNGEPSGAVAAYAVCFGKPREGHAEHIITGDGGHVDSLGAFVGDLLVDFVGKNHELMFTRHISNLLQNLAGVHSTGGVVGVNNHNAPGALGNLRLDVFNIRVPVVLFVAQVMHGVAACKRGGGGPQRVVGHRNQNFIPRFA